MFAAAPPLASVCIPAYRRPHELARAIESVLAQGVRDIEIVVSDDGGELESVVTGIADPRVRYFRNRTTLGMAGNYRAALERARSPFVCVLDDDDRYLPGFLPSVLDAFDRDPSLGVVFTGVYVDDGRSLTPRMPDVAPGRHEGFLAELVRRLPIICSATMMRREALLEDGRVLRLVGGIRADTLLWLRPAMLGWSFCYLAEPLVAYHTDSPARVSAQEERMRDDSVELWEALAFDDPEAERLRRQRLAEALMLRAATLLKRGQSDQARADLDSARAQAPGFARKRLWMTRSLLRAPWLVPMAWRIRELTRPLMTGLPGRHRRTSSQSDIIPAGSPHRWLQ